MYVEFFYVILHIIQLNYKRMKIIYLLILIVTLGFSSCSLSSEKEQLATHTCDATCKKEGCTEAKCGEKGHECKASCHKKDESGAPEEESHESQNH